MWDGGQWGQASGLGNWTRSRGCLMSGFGMLAYVLEASILDNEMTANIRVFATEIFKPDETRVEQV